MGKSQNLNTAVKITFEKLGTTKEYSTVEEASKDTGLSITSIKMRCNKFREGSSNKKDKIHCMWIDDTTFRSFQSKKSRNKGSGFEMEIVNRLKEIGYSNVCRSASESKKLDNNKVDIADPSNELEFAIQAKYTQNLPNYFKLQESCPDPRPFCLLWKKAADVGSISDGTVAIIPIDLFYQFVKLYHK